MHCCPCWNDFTEYIKSFFVKNEEQKLDDIYKNMIKKIERIKKKIYILENKKEDLEENLYDIKV